MPKLTFRMTDFILWCFISLFFSLVYNFNVVVIYRLSARIEYIKFIPNATSLGNLNINHHKSTECKFIHKIFFFFSHFFLHVIAWAFIILCFLLISSFFIYFFLLDLWYQVQASIVLISVSQ